MSDFEDLFDEADPLEDALKTPEAKEITEDDLTLVGTYNMTFDFNEDFTKKYPDKKIFYKNQPTSDFLEYYLTRCSIQEAMNIKTKELSDAKKEMIEKKIAERDDIVKSKETDDLYKKIAKLQEERDIAQSILNKTKKILVKRVIERDAYKKVAHELTKIFIEQKIEAEISEQSLKIIQEEFIDA